LGCGLNFYHFAPPTIFCWLSPPPRFLRHARFEMLSGPPPFCPDSKPPIPGAICLKPIYSEYISVLDLPVTAKTNPFGGQTVPPLTPRSNVLCYSLSTQYVFFAFLFSRVLRLASLFSLLLAYPNGPARTSCRSLFKLRFPLLRRLDPFFLLCGPWGIPNQGSFKKFRAFRFSPPIDALEVPQNHQHFPPFFDPNKSFIVRL